MRKQQKFSEKEVLRFFGMLIIAVYHLHSEGIIHRDINPANIMVSNEGNIREILKLGGFGNAIHEGQSLINNYIDVYGADSVPNFMAPEQTRGENPTHKSDVWACGAMLYYLNTFKMPFQGTNRYATQENIRKQDLQFKDVELSEDYKEAIS